MGLLRRLALPCWGDHDWIYKTNTRGLWLECRHCGEESPGLELATPRYRRTQDGAEEAHRLGGVPPARRIAAAADPPAAPLAPRFWERRASRRSVTAETASTSWDVTASSSAVAATDAERRWLQAWRALSPEERVLAERMVAELSMASLETRGDNGRSEAEAAAPLRVARAG